MVTFKARRSNPAFSLIELVVVVVIIGVIGAIAIPRMSRASVGESATSLIADLDSHMKESKRQI